MRNVLLLVALAGCASSGTSGSPPRRPAATARSAPPPLVAADPAPDRGKPVLEIVFPAASGPSVDALFALKEGFGVVEGDAYDYAGFRVTIGDQPARMVAPGGELSVKLPVPADGVLRFHVDGTLVFAAIDAGGRFFFDTHTLGGEWNARTVTASPWNPAYQRCVAESDGCAADETHEPSSEDDPACPGETHHFCVKSPRVRLRGPSQEVVHAIGSHTDPEEDDTRLVAGGPAHPLYLHHCRQPYLTVGEETVVLLGSYGEDWTVFRNAAGQIDASVTAIVP
jgi:hypothetical protein